MTKFDISSTTTLTVEQSLQQAIALHQTGDIQGAKRIYLAILKAQPKNPVANYNLGVLAIQTKEFLIALPYFKMALETNPRHLPYWLSYFDAMIRAQQLESARQLLQRGRNEGLTKEAIAAMSKRLDSLAAKSFTPPLTPHAVNNQAHRKSEQTNRKQRRGVEAKKRTINKNSQILNPSAPSKSQASAPTAAEIQTLINLFHQGRFKEIEVLARQITEKFPHHGFGWKALGTALKLQGQVVQSLEPLRKAAALLPDDAEAQYNLGVTLKGLGRLREAEGSFRRAVEIKPDYAEAHSNLGVTLKELLQLQEAEACYRRALKIHPDFAEAHNNLGVTLQDLGRLAEAEDCFRAALKIKPGSADVHNNLAKTLQSLGRPEEAERSYRQALAIKPDFAEAHGNLGISLHNMGRLLEAEASYRRALTINPNLAASTSNLGLTVHALGRLQEAVNWYRQALKIRPDFAEAHNNLGIALQDLGRLEEAEASFRRALEIKPDYVRAESNLLFSLSYSALHPPSQHLEEARKYGGMVTKMAGTHFSLWSCDPRPKRLRVGVVSGDLYNHPVGFFLESVLSQIDQSRIELIAYPTDNKTDELTARIKPYFSAWKSLVGQSDKEAALLIHGDGIHLLLDISGHMARSRLPIFAWKPAPVQASWMGFLGTTGVQEIDYVIGDPIATPPEDEGNFSEKVWRLPEVYCCFTPPDFEVEVGPLPALTAGYVTFGCFNHLSKMTDEVVALWARVLKAVPDSRLFLKTRQLDDPSVCETTRKRFAAQGIDSSRLLLEGASPRAELLAAYQRVDIALDPFPYNGGTSNMESLWMAVPFITRRGDRFLSRCGQSIAANAGLADWIAEGDEDYIAKAQKHAANLEGLAALRSQLRQQVLASPLYDAPRFAKHFEDALWGMWKEHARKTGSRKK